jgi:hypothetical protein
VATRFRGLAADSGSEFATMRSHKCLSCSIFDDSSGYEHIVVAHHLEKELKQHMHGVPSKVQECPCRTWQGSRMRNGPRKQVVALKCGR